MIGYVIKIKKLSKKGQFILKIKDESLMYNFNLLLSSPDVFEKELENKIKIGSKLYITKLK